MVVYICHHRTLEGEGGRKGPSVELGRYSEEHGKTRRHLGGWRKEGHQIQQKRKQHRLETIELEAKNRSKTPIKQ